MYFTKKLIIDLRKWPYYLNNDPSSVFSPRQLSKRFMIASAEVVFVGDKRQTELDILHPNKAVLPNARNYLKRRQRHLDISHSK